MTTQTVHASIFTREISDMVAPRDGDTILDATLGGGGHAEMFLQRARVTVIGIDADAEALARARARLETYGDRMLYLQGNFRDLRRLLSSIGIDSLSHALFDLGLSSDQLEASGRGFSFMRNEPLSMTFEKESSGFTAKDILQDWSEESIANVLWGYGEEKYAKRIAHAIVVAREKAPIETTAQLVSLIHQSVPALYRKGRTNPATRTFQALRIAVNDELASVERGVLEAIALLKKGGRIAVISFHSLEDRVVKRSFRGMETEGQVSIITKKPLTPSLEEVRRNPRARSAKLRVAEKL